MPRSLRTLQNGQTGEATVDIGHYLSSVCNVSTHEQNGTGHENCKFVCANETQGIALTDKAYVRGNIMTIPWSVHNPKQVSIKSLQ